MHADDAQVLRQLAVFLGNRFIGGLVVVDQIHLVDRQHDLPDAQQATYISVAARLRQHALARVDQHHRQLGVGRAGGHVARVLLVARAVGHDEAAPRGMEVAVRHVDGDALLALGIQAVGEQREIEHVAGADVLTPAVACQRRQLIVRQHAGVVQQTAEQAALAVIHTAAGDETQQALGG
jgi:hypothetical protein